MTRVKVIENLHKIAGFTEEEGWKYKWWTQTLPIKLPKKKSDASEQYALTEFKRPYIVHEDGTVITCQKKAWMDTAGICMWVELILKPWLDANECPEWGALLTWDHCGPHMTSAVHETLKRFKIWAECLPKNMTDWLQIMDLVVNGPYKLNTRRLLCEDLREYMQEFRMLFYRAKLKGDAPLDWNPPKPALSKGLLNSRKAITSMDNNPNFRDGMRKAFVQVGLVPFAGDV
eukprot:1186342-Rhodomonas_salina.1